MKELKHKLAELLSNIDNETRVSLLWYMILLFTYELAKKGFLKEAIRIVNTVPNLSEDILDLKLEIVEEYELEINYPTSIN